MSAEPQVTGLRPRLGPSTGGVPVTIRGSDLGLSKEDVIGRAFVSVTLWGVQSAPVSRQSCGCRRGDHLRDVVRGIAQL